MEYNEDSYLMVSGIQHFAFCRRQWALIHIDEVWAENERTAEGRIIHDTAHDVYRSESRGEVILSRAMPIFSHALGLSGECDVVEFRRTTKDGISLHGRDGLYTVYPVEYKRGSPKENPCDILQMTAQAMCLEEMLYGENIVLSVNKKNVDGNLCICLKALLYSDILAFLLHCLVNVQNVVLSLHFLLLPEDFFHEV